MNNPVQTTRSCRSVFASTALADRWCTKVSKNPDVTLYIDCSTVKYANGVLQITHQELHNVNPHLTGLSLGRIKMDNQVGGTCSTRKTKKYTKISRESHKEGFVTLWLIYEGWNFNSGNYLFTTDTKQIHVSKFYCPSMQSPALCTARCQRCGSRRIPLAAPVVLIVRMERSTA